jgi:hypothetical protein
MLQRFGKTKDAAIAATAADLCVCLPLDAAMAKDAAVLLDLAKQAVNAQPMNAGYLQTLGAALYRAGNYPAAAERLQEAVTRQGKGGTVSA